VLEEFREAVRTYRFEPVALDPRALERAAAALDRTGLLVVGEAHGLRETADVVHALAAELGIRRLGLEWAHEEMTDLDLDRLFALPPGSEFLGGDGRITAGSVALAASMDGWIPFDRLDPTPLPPWQVRDREMAERLLGSLGAPTIAVVGAFHARLDEPDTMASVLARELPGLVTAMLAYPGVEMPPAEMTFTARSSTPAVLPGHSA
jgi:hypothetical protein